MPIIKVKDGTEIYYKDWGSGQPIVFSHGWPLSADDWDAQMLFFLNKGFRVIAHDRRGHGRSTQTGDGHDMDHYADDLAALTAHLDLKNAVHVGHSTGGGEVATGSKGTIGAGDSLGDGLGDLDFSDFAVSTNDLQEALSRAESEDKRVRRGSIDLRSSIEVVFTEVGGGG